MCIRDRGDRVRRRDFMMLIGGAAAWPLATRAQPTKVPRLGVLLVANREPFSRLFWEGLRELGYIDGQNIQIEFRSAEGKLNLLPELACLLYTSPSPRDRTRYR